MSGFYVEIVKETEKEGNTYIREMVGLELTDLGNKVELYNEMASRYGRCKGKLYFTPNEFADNISEPFPVGWVFERKHKYKDPKDNEEKSYILRRRVYVYTRRSKLSEKAFDYYYNIDQREEVVITHEKRREVDKYGRRQI